MIYALIALAIALVLLVVLRRPASPSRIAARHLDAQIARMRAEIKTLQFVDRDLIAHQEAAIREQWLRNEMTNRDVASLDVPGFGEALFDTLREHGIVKMQDVERLRRRKVPGIGVKRAEQLWTAYREETAKLRDAAQALARDTLDELSGGKLGAIIETHAAEELQRQRQLEQCQVQLAELERRRVLVRANR